VTADIPAFDDDKPDADPEIAAELAELRAALKAMLDGYKRAVQAGSIAVEGFVSAAILADGLLQEASDD
jgi:hypothetical protein